MARYDGILEAATRFLENERKTSKDRSVRLLTGHFKGREGVCTGVTIDEQHSGRGLQLLYCIYVLRADGTGILNTIPASRSYRPQEDFEWI